MLKVPVGLSVCAFLFVLSGPAFAGSALTVEAAVNNCQNRHIDLEPRISACNALIHSGLISHKMLGVFYMMRGKAYADAKDDANAMQDFDTALEKFPALADAHIERGLLYYRESDNPHALADLDEAVAEAPDAYAPSLMRCEVRLSTNANPAGALGDCEVAVKAKPQDADALEWRGRAHLALGQCAEARADFGAAATSDPSRAGSLPSADSCRPPVTP